MMIFRIFLAAVMCAAGTMAVHAMEKEKPKLKQVIKPKYIAEEVNQRLSSFLEKNRKYVPKISEEVNAAVLKFLNNNKAFVDDVTDITHVQNDKDPKHPENNKLQIFYNDIKPKYDKELKNLSQWSFAIPVAVGDDKVLVRLSGPLHTRENFNTQRGAGWGENYTEDSLDNYLNEYGEANFQNISRFTNNIIARRAVAEKKLKNYYIPESFPIKIPWRQGPLISDKNYVVVEEFIPNTLPLGDPKAIETFTKEKIATLYDWMKAIPFWNIGENGSNIAVAQDGTIIPVDFEQPNNIAPSWFLDYPPRKFAHDIFAGAESLHKLLIQKGRTDLADEILSLVKDDLDKLVNDPHPQIIEAAWPEQYEADARKTYKQDKEIQKKMSEDEYVLRARNDAIRGNLTGYFLGELRKRK